MEIHEIIGLHGKLAKRIKQFESSLEIYPPKEVLNELRYALRAVIELLECNIAGVTGDDFDHAIQKSHHALLCAYHDLVDGMAIHVSLSLDKLSEDYLEESIVVLGSKRLEIIDFLNELNEKVATSREQPRTRKKIYEEEIYANYFDKLLEYRKFISGKVIDDIVNLYLSNQKKNKKILYLAVGSIVFGILGIVIALFK